MSKNDITGDALKSRPDSKAYEENFLILKRECGLCHQYKVPFGADAMTWLEGKPVCVECGGDFGEFK